MPWIIGVAGDITVNKAGTSPCCRGTFLITKTDFKRIMIELCCGLKCAIKKYKRKT